MSVRLTMSSARIIICVYIICARASRIPRVARREDSMSTSTRAVNAPATTPLRNLTGKRARRRYFDRSCGSRCSSVPDDVSDQHNPLPSTLMVFRLRRDPDFTAIAVERADHWWRSLVFCHPEQECLPRPAPGADTGLSTQHVASSERGATIASSCAAQSSPRVLGRSRAACFASSASTCASSSPWKRSSAAQPSTQPRSARISRTALLRPPRTRVHIYFSMSLLLTSQSAAPISGPQGVPCTNYPHMATESVLPSSPTCTRCSLRAG